MTHAVRPQPGIARRADNYDDQVRKAASARPSPALNRLLIDKALALGTAGELTPQERCLMMALLCHLDVAATANGQSAVWPGSRRLCALLGLGESTLRRLKGSLEAKGYLLRRYDRCNRPLRGGALDLAPFLARVEHLCAKIGHTDREIRLLHDSDRAEREDCRPITSAGAPMAERPNRNSQQDTSERRERWSEGEELSAEAQADIAMAETLIPGIRQDLPQAADDILGAKKAQRLWHWAEKRRGSGALLALAIAGADTKIKDPAAWFAWYATTAAEVDLTALAARLKPRPAAPVPLPTEGPRGALLAGFASRAGEDAARSYLLGAEICIEAGRLDIAVASRMAERRLKERFTTELQAAAQSMGCSTVRIVTREAERPEPRPSPHRHPAPPASRPPS